MAAEAGYIISELSLPIKDPGVATKLVKEVERRMKRKGVVKVNALVYASNDRSLKFFEKMGYEMDRTLLKHGKEL